MIRILFVIIFTFIYEIQVTAQQRPQFTQFMLNKYYENPAYGGLDRSLSANLIYRDQYNTLTGNPKTFFAGAHMPVYLWNGAIGFSISNQRSGLINQSAVKLSYNYVMSTTIGFLSFGGRAGLDYVSVDGSGILTPDGNYEGGIDHNDPILDKSTFTGMGINYEIAAYFFGEDVEAGITLGELPPQTIAIGPANYKKSFFGNVFMQYKYKLDRFSSLISGLLLKADQAALQLDIFALYKMNSGVFGGLTFRGYNSASLDAIGVVIGSKINNNYTISYSYDIGISELRLVNEGSHEILLSYNLNKLIGIGLPPKIIYNPRHL
ncbi:MAG: PorP/SprF family type IX secretion system membrane protein [Saprospiraceae bacterium]|nr:PorP/SprF family type IX secretion system membrane protein [Saprospiraceae bacterium]